MSSLHITLMPRYKLISTFKTMAQTPSLSYKVSMRLGPTLEFTLEGIKGFFGILYDAFLVPKENFVLGSTSLALFTTV